VTTALVWFRRDLRLADNDALTHAARNSARLLAVYIHAAEDADGWQPGAASRWWLHHSLSSLSESMARIGGRLLLRRGAILDTLQTLIREFAVDMVCFNRLYEPARLAADDAIRRELEQQRVAVYVGRGHLLCEPWEISTSSRAPYRVFTPYARRLNDMVSVEVPLPAPRRLIPAAPRAASLSVDDLGLLPRIPWDAGLARAWQPGERGARRRLRSIPALLPGYAHDRDFPGTAGTTRLSPHLHFGEISPRQVGYALQQAQSSGGSGAARGAAALRRELQWREFAHHVLHHFPRTPDAPLDARFAKFRWRRSARLLHAWQRGETGIPIVDAGMRELWNSGWMHNRVRMIAASFLTKHARIDWRDGSRWFWDTLVDADLANNTLNWQWVAGCGADAAPYFRIFNPVLQSRKFAGDGIYIRRWLPELAALPDRHLHAPWLAPGSVLRESGVRIGRDYPPPVLDLAAERRAALAAFAAMRRVRRKEKAA
jgi:deoxyribodipyrimidine photo-lyase